MNENGAKQLFRTEKTNSKFILKRYDKNLLQRYSGSVAREIPIVWGF